MVVETDAGVRTLWFAAPPNAARRGRLGRGLWLHWRARTAAAALRAGLGAPSPAQRLMAAWVVAWEATATWALGAVAWACADAWPASRWWLPLVVAATRLGLGHGGRARRRWHALEHRVLDEVQPSACGATTQVAATVLAAAASTVALAMELRPPGIAVVDVLTFAAVVAWAPAVHGVGAVRFRGADESWARPRIAALRELVATVQASSLVPPGGPGAVAASTGVASDLGAVYTVAPEGRSTASAN